MGNFAFNSATILLAKSQQKAWERGEEGGRQVKEEGAVAMLVILREEDVWGGGGQLQRGC